MPSPFPGMNPYFETANGWPDFHMNCLVTIRRKLAKRLAGRYFVRFNERDVYYELPGTSVSPCYVVQSSAAADMPGQSELFLERAPVQVFLPEMGKETERWLEVMEPNSRRVVTTLDLLSPAVKTDGFRRDAYLPRRKQLMYGDSHFVEIDLLRGGLRPTLPPLPPSDYYALVRENCDRRTVGVWPISLRDRLPEIPIPLAEPDAPVMVDLQSVLDETYDEAAYEYEIYSHTPEPPLPPADAAWAAGFVPAGRGPVV